ncbi:hypothetical protein FRC03_009197 [Tulasnella sp. 419]|nr:hypothetical protein FRC03_009197 [Tulasnella sp. 419]
MPHEVNLRSPQDYPWINHFIPSSARTASISTHPLHLSSTFPYTSQFTFALSSTTTISDETSTVSSAPPTSICSSVNTRVHEVFSSLNTRKLTMTSFSIYMLFKQPPLSSNNPRVTELNSKGRTFANGKVLRYTIRDKEAQVAESKAGKQTSLR